MYISFHSIDILLFSALSIYLRNEMKVLVESRFNTECVAKLPNRLWPLLKDGNYFEKQIQINEAHNRKQLILYIMDKVFFFIHQTEMVFVFFLFLERNKSRPKEIFAAK